MNDVKVTYRFVRDDRAGFFSTNRPSTDALGMLMNWKAELPSREFNVIVDADDELVVTLKTTRADVDADQGGMTARCSRHGVSREVVKTINPAKPQP